MASSAMQGDDRQFRLCRLSASLCVLVRRPGMNLTATSGQNAQQATCLLGLPALLLSFYFHKQEQTPSASDYSDTGFGCRLVAMLHKRPSTAELRPRAPNGVTGVADWRAKQSVAKAGQLWARLTAAVLVAQVREAPHVGQVDGESYNRQQEVHLLAPVLSAVAVTRQGPPAGGRCASAGGVGGHGRL
jgi:hypothetical protein